MSSAVLSGCTSPASYWMPTPSVAEAGWIEHAPFGFWLIDALRPKTVVELGTRTGASYFVFCQAVQTIRLDCRCYAIVEPKAGTGASDSALKLASDHNASQYAAFSRLSESEIGKAAADFAERSVDVLCFAEGTPPEIVRAAMDQWRSRLGEGGVVLLHGINSPEHGGGHGRLWHEVVHGHKHFEFLHGGGLGVLCIGKTPPALETLFQAASDNDALHAVRTVYTRLGQALSDRAAREAAETQLRNLATVSPSPARSVEPQPAGDDDHVAKLKLELAQKSKLMDFVSALASQREAERDAARAQFEAMRTRFDLIVQSKSWRMMQPVRDIMQWPGMRTLRRIFR